MASQFAPPHHQEEIFNVYGGNDFQYSNFEYNPNETNTIERNGRSSVPNYMKPTQASRRRAKSADARPQYRSSSSSKSRPVQPTKSYEDRLLDELLEQQFDHDADVQRLPQQHQQQQQQTTYQEPQIMQLPTHDGDHFMGPNFGEATERIHFERDMSNPFSSGGAAPQQELPFEQHRDIPYHQKEEKEEGLFDPFGGEWSPEDDKRRWDMPYNPSPTYPTPTNQAAAQQRQKVQGTRSFPDTSPAAYPTTQTSSSQPRKVQGTKSFPASSGKSSTATSTKSQQNGDWKSNMMKTTLVLKPKTKAVKEQVKAISNRLSSAMSRARSQNPTSDKSAQRRSKSQPAPRRNHKGQVIADSGIMRPTKIPTPKKTNVISRSKDENGSFDVEYDFYGDGFTQSRTYSQEGSQVDGFRVIQPERQQDRQIKPDVVAPSYTSKRPAPVSYAQYLAKSKIPSTRGAFSKVSPTSVMDVHSNSNVRWSQNLSQTTTPRATEDNPDSILRKRYPGSNEYHSEPTSVNFRDEDSPTSDMRAKPARSMDESDLMSLAYSEFIESVAAVVIQTTVRRFLAKLLVDKIRVQVAAASKYRYNRKRIEGKTQPVVVVPNGQIVQHRSRVQQDSMANTRMEYQLFVFAAIRIQSVFRGWFVRDILKIEQYCAKMIQKNARSFVYRNQYQYDLFRIIIAQSVVRRFLVCRNLFAAPDPEVTRVLDFAATMIQARWRGFVAEMRYYQDYGHILISQSVVRRWLAIRYCKAMQSSARNPRKPTNRFGKQHGARRSFGNVQQKVAAPQISKWSNTRNVPWRQPSSSNAITPSPSTEEPRSANQAQNVPTGMGSIAKRRAMFESNRLNTVQQEEANKQKAAVEMAELQAMQRKVGVRTSPGTQTGQPQRAKSMSGRIQSQTNKKWGSDFRPKTQGGKVSSFEISGSVVTSDVETEVQSNLKSTSRLLQGWRDREQSNSFDQRHSFDRASERSNEVEGRGSNTLSAIGVSKYLGGKTGNQMAAPPSPHESVPRLQKSKQQDVGPSMQEIMRSKRSAKESARIQQIEDVFTTVGLMRHVNRPRLNVSQPPPELERKYSSPLRKTNSFKAEQSPTQATNQPHWIQPSRSLDSSPKTERKLFHDEPNNEGDEQAALKIWRNSRQPPRANNNRASLPPRQELSGAERRSIGASPVNERSKNLMNSLGLNTSYGSSDMSDMENSPSPAFMRRFQKVPASPIQKANLFGAQEQQQSANTPQRPVFSQFQIQKQGERSQEVQSKLNDIHAIFEKVGLMQSVA